MAVPFVIELLDRAWKSFLLVLGTTTLGFLAGTIALFLAVEFATWIGTWVVRGKDAMRQHKKENFLIGVLIYFAALLTIYLPIYVRQIWTVDRAIWSEAETQPIPHETSRASSVPAFAYEMSPASMSIRLTPQEGFSFDLAGPYKLDFKRQYLLVFTNSKHPLKLVDVQVHFPYPVEAQKTIKVTKIRRFIFRPSRPILNLIGAQLEGGGCLGRWSYDLHILDAEAGSQAEVSLILNGWSSAHPEPGFDLKPPANGYIAGFFVHTYRGTVTRTNYYVTLEPSKDTMITTPEAQSRMPTGFRKSSGFTVLEGPCIPDSSLLTP